MHPILNVATIAAREAGEFIINELENVGQLKIEEKGRNDYVTEIDRVAEDIIIRTIRQYYPDHNILAEESGKHTTPSHFEWIIDPLDGTTNFLHELPHFAISIAVREKGKLMHGVVYDPVKNELFSASRGDGAKMNDFRIRVSGQKKLDKALLATGFPYHDFSYVDAYMASLKELMLQTAGIRRGGSAALDLAYVAAGRVDGYWEFNLKPWDIAAGALIVMEAGGLVTDFTGDDNFLTSGNIVAGNPKMLQAMAKTISQTIPKELRR